MKLFYQRAVTLLLLVGCFIVLCGVDACEVSNSIKIIGTWNNGEYELVFNNDGTFQASLTTNGTYTISENEMRLIDNLCGTIEGTYEISINEDTLTFVLVSDLCEDRGSVLPGDYKKGSLILPVP